MNEETSGKQGTPAAETPVAERSLLGVLASDANQIITSGVTAVALYGGKKVWDKIHGPGPGDGPKADSPGDGGESGSA